MSEVRIIEIKEMCLRTNKSPEDFYIDLSRLLQQYSVMNREYDFVIIVDGKPFSIDRIDV